MPLDQPGSDWMPLRGIDVRRLKDARLQAHYAVQWLARFARAYVHPLPDDGHTNLGWDRALGGFTTHPLKDGTWLSLKITDFTLALHAGEEGTHVQSFPLDGCRDAQARRWLSEQLGARGLDPRALDAPAPYEMPAHTVAYGAVYDPAGLTDALAELVAWFGNARLSLGSIQRQMIGCKLAASPIRCWPHHFDLATLITLPARKAGATGYIGAGLSPGDGYYDEPYFYVSVHPEPDPAALPSLPILGHWHLRDFMAAVATSHKITAAKTQQVETEDFLQAAVHGAIKVIRLKQQ
jgi:hypothetical protein